jgi:hypothetical protein
LLLKLFPRKEGRKEGRGRGEVKVRK